MSPAPLVVFAVPTRDRSESLVALLETFDAQAAEAGVEWRALVWDDASSEGERARLRAWSGWGREQIEVRFSEGVERMRAKRHLDDMAVAAWDRRGEAYLAHLDDDVLPHPGWLAAALEPLRAGRFDGCGSAERVDGRLVLSGQTELQIEPVPVDGRVVRVWEWRREYVDGRRGAVEVAFAGHRAMVVRLESVAAVPHDPAYTIGGEDLDWSLALRVAGQRLGIACDAVIDHRARGEHDAPDFRAREHVLRSWRHFHGKWGFVRGGAASEAGLERDEWLRRVSA